ncbi:MAG: hypothetical protein DRJ65_04225 [Acidobacteria bacterium]|nr:MAG: hypothetical protein DRJ65_04225 [Acidobacteriota bacterium]
MAYHAAGDFLKRLIPLLIVCSWSFACQDSGNTGGRPTPGPSATKRAPAQSAATDHDDLERLRALGYLDYSEEIPQAPGAGTQFLDQQRAFPGSTLVIYGGTCSAELITLEGQVLNSWSMGSCRRWDQAVLGSDGSLLVVGSRSDTNRPVSEQMESSFLIKLSWSNEVLWQRKLPAHHDVEILPEGDMLTLLLKRRMVEAVDPEAEVWDNPIGHLDSEGQLIEEISLYDILAAPSSGFPLRITGRGSAQGERWIDLLHCNEIEVVGHTEMAARHPIYSDDHLLITSRSQDMVMVVNWRTRELIWHWGQGQLSGPHGATVLTNGNLLIFDNGLEQRWSRVIELDPVNERIVNELGPPNRSEFFSRVMGAAQGLPNGNVLITNSAGGQGLELTATGLPAWVFMGTHRTDDGYRIKIPRMTRISTAKTKALLDHMQRR